MLTILERGGAWGQLAFVTVVVGIPVLLAVVMVWHRRRDVTAAAVAAAAERDDSPLQQYRRGRDAALHAALPASGQLLTAVLLAWAGSLLTLALLNFLGTPSLATITEVFRGRVQLPPSQPMEHFTGYISRTLVAGSLASLLAVPALVFALLSAGFVGTWLLGTPMDRALLRVIGDIEGRFAGADGGTSAADASADVVESAPEGADPASAAELDELRRVAAALGLDASRRWPVSAFIAGPFWYLGHGQVRRAVRYLVAWVAMLLTGLGLWVLVSAVFFDGEPMHAGTLAGVLWHHLRETVAGLCVLPVFLHAAIRRPGVIDRVSCPGTTPPDPAPESAPAAPRRSP
jgi:hypothetical protein